MRAVALGDLTEAQAADRRAHLTTVIAGLKLLSLDDRVRKAGKQLGFDVLPA